MTPEAKAIAAKLTEAQRAALCYPSGYHDPNTIKALRRRGLWDRGLLSPLGVEVAAILKDQPHV